MLKFMKKVAVVLTSVAIVTGINATMLNVGIDLWESEKMSGYEKIKNYDASYYEWAGDKSNPVEK